MVPFDRTLLNRLEKLCAEQQKSKEFKKRLRIKGKIQEKSLTKKGNLKLRIKKGENVFKIVVLQNHKEKFKLAENMVVNSSVYAEGLPKLGFILCTKLNLLTREIDESEQIKLGEFSD